MKNVTGLACKECARTYPVAALHVCEFCFGPLEVAYDYAGIRASVDRAGIERGPSSLWRYSDLLPAPEGDLVDMGAGWTRLRPAPRLAAELGMKRLWLKNDGGNPTHSFKDRVVSLAVSVARSFGYSVVACASTGNLANAVAAHAAAAGMDSVVFIPSDLEAGKIAATVVYGGKVIAVDGSYDDVNRLCAELAGTKDWAFVNVNLRPFYSEGSKTLAFETIEQLGWRIPDAFVIPIASGSLFTKIAKGVREMLEVGLVEGDEPALFGAQAEGCSPVATAWREGAAEVQPVKPRTVAKSLAIGNPADGFYALEEARRSGGHIDAVGEASVADGMRLLARTEGIFTETAGGVTIAALEQMVRKGTIDTAAETVALITGVGLKTLEALEEAAVTATVRPSLAEVERVLEGLWES
ncbi:MAG TPA: threonine synthase [Actinomycetota bacterium]|nr:threonine synthase [Actinomycetota bacterium]